jgi:hypothetical protein
MFRNFLPGAILLAMIVASLLGLFLGWSSVGKIVRSVSLPSWRKVMAYIGLFAVTAQAFIFIALWTPLVRYDQILSHAVSVELVLFLIAVPCIFWGRLQRRWWLIASAVFLPVVSWFSVLAEIAY